MTSYQLSPSLDWLLTCNQDSHEYLRVWSNSYQVVFFSQLLLDAAVTSYKSENMYHFTYNFFDPFLLTLWGVQNYHSIRDPIQIFFHHSRILIQYPLQHIFSLCCSLVPELICAPLYLGNNLEQRVSKKSAAKEDIWKQDSFASSHGC